MKYGKKKLQYHAADDSTDKSGFHPGGAFLVHWTQQQKCVQRQPVTMVCLAGLAVGEPNRQDNAEAQRETCLEHIQSHPMKQLP